MKLHIDSFSVALPGVVLGAPVIVYNNDNENDYINDDDIDIPSVVLRTATHMYNITFEDNDCDD